MHRILRIYFSTTEKSICVFQYLEVFYPRMHAGVYRKHVTYNMHDDRHIFWSKDYSSFVFYDYKY
jgi:hypothetical protein